ncbi:MAG: hypothetical protein ABGW78_09885 [Pirellulales bacterium]
MNDDPQAAAHDDGDNRLFAQYSEHVLHMHENHGFGSENEGRAHENQRVQAWTPSRTTAAVTRLLLALSKLV